MTSRTIKRFLTIFMIFALSSSTDNCYYEAIDRRALKAQIVNGNRSSVFFVFFSLFCFSEVQKFPIQRSEVPTCSGFSDTFLGRNLDFINPSSTFLIESSLHKKNLDN